MQESNELLTYSPEEVEQLIAMTEDLQTENEQQRAELKELNRQTQQQSSELLTALSKIQTLTEKLSEQQQQTQMLLYENQRLQSRVQQLTDRNESLQSSDEQLKKAKELQNSLKEKEKDLLNEVKRSQEKALHSEKKANTAISKANTEKEEASKRKAEYDKMIENEKKAVQEKAEQMNEQYRNRCQFIWFIAILYNILATIFTGFQSERVVADCTDVVMTVKNFCVNGFLKIVDLSEKAGSIGDKIEQPIVSEIVGISLKLIVFLVICSILAVLYFVGKFIVNVYKENCFDEISLFVVTLTIAVLVWFANFMPLNIILMLILSHILYIVVRWYIKSYKENH